MDQIQEILPLLIPLIIAQYTLAIFAVIHVIKHPNYRFGNRILWIIVVLLVQFIGPIVYFLFGRGEES